MAKVRAVNPTSAQWAYAAEFIKSNNKFKALDIGYPKWKDKPINYKRKRIAVIHAARGTGVALQELKNDLRRLESISLGSHISVLEELRDEAREAKKYGDAIKAHVKIGETLGFYNKTEISIHASMSPNELKSRFLGILEKNSSAVKSLGVRVQAPTVQVQETEPSHQDSPEQTEVVIDAEVIEPTHSPPETPPESPHRSLPESHTAPETTPDP